MATSQIRVPLARLAGHMANVPGPSTWTRPWSGMRSSCPNLMLMWMIGTIALGRLGLGVLMPRNDANPMNIHQRTRMAQSCWAAAGYHPLGTWWEMLVLLSRCWVKTSRIFDWQWSRDNPPGHCGTNGELGLTNLLEHKINRITPSQSNSSRTAAAGGSGSPANIRRGAIEPSDSPWASPIVIAKKKDLTPCFCLDYRALNATKVKDAFPLPCIDASIDALSGAAWFSTLDLASGYSQVPVAKRDCPKIAFLTRNGLYQWWVMPFRLSNAPATFERLMDLVLQGLTFDRGLVYLDNLSSLVMILTMP